MSFSKHKFIVDVFSSESVDILPALAWSIYILDQPPSIMTESEVETPGEASNYSQETQLLSPKVRQRSPYPIYIVSLLFYLGDAIGTNIVLEAVVYNKVCYSHFANVSLCTNATFSKNHPDLQVEFLC